MREIRQSPIEWFIKSFSILTALMFVVSGALNALLFSMVFGVNFFLVATPADVIMSAFFFGTAVIVATLASGFAAWALNKFLGGLLDRGIAALGRRLNVDVPEKRKHTTFDLLWLCGLYTIMLSLIFSVYGIDEGLPLFYRSGLLTTPSQVIDGQPCGDRPVAWMGSSAAIIDCEPGYRLVHKLDDLVTTPRHDRREIFGSTAPQPRSTVPAPKPTPPPDVAQPAKPHPQQPYVRGCQASSGD